MRRSRRNTESMRCALDQLDSMLRKADMSEPLRGNGELLRRTSCTLERLWEKAEEAKRLIARAGRKAGLDERRALAETLSPCMVVAFHEAFCEMFERARGMESNYPMRRINIAASVLLGQIDSDALLHESEYPEEESLRAAVMESKICRAKSAYSDVCSALDSMHTVLEVELPTIKGGL